jgi:hypothetical protein
MDESMAQTWDFCEKLENDLNANESKAIRIIPKLEARSRSLTGGIVDVLTVEWIIGKEGEGVYRKLCVDFQTGSLLQKTQVERRAILAESLAGILVLAKSPDALRPGTKSNFKGKWGSKSIATDFPFCLFSDGNDQLIEFATEVDARQAFHIFTSAGRRDPNQLHILKFEDHSWIEIDPMG